MFSWKCSMVQFLCVCILLREKSSSHVGGSWFWLLKKSSMIVVFLRWKLPHVFWTVWRTHILWAVIELNLYFEFILDQKSKTFFLDFFLVYREDVFFSSIFHLQKEIMFVFWPFLAPNIASHPEHKSFVFLNMLVWLMKISFLQKLKSTDYPFCVQNTSQKFISDMFYDRRHVYCKCFHLLFLIRCFFIKSIIEKRKIQFLVTKRGQKPYPICFFEP